MDLQQSKCFATAQRELQELFREISSQGRVSATELQLSVLPYTAGDVRQDVLELIEELKNRQLLHKSGAVDEQEFVRLLWRKMYVPHLVESQRVRPTSATSAASSSRSLNSSHTDATISDFNIPLAHVIVSIKRRSQLKQFADYYASRGISGADHLSVPTNASAAGRGSPRPSSRSSSDRQRHRRRACFDRNIPMPVATIRAHTSGRYTAIACVFDPEERVMKTLNLLPRDGVRFVQVTNCSRLHCLLFSKDAGNFVLGSAHFAQHAHHRHIENTPGSSGEGCQKAPANTLLPASLSVLEDVLILTKLEDLGLRHVVAVASSVGSFVACTERKIHHWTDQNHSSSFASAAFDSQDDRSQTPRNDTGNNTMTTVDIERDGDCFGVLGAKKLLTRTKSIADIVGVKQLATGNSFSLARTATGNLFVWGGSTLGHHELSPWRTPWFRPAKVTRIACGRDHALVTTDSGCAYAWGSNMYGQLGHGNSCSMTNPPVHEPIAIKVPLSPRQTSSRVDNPSLSESTLETSRAVLDVACGDDHSLLLLGSGHLLTFGNNWQGQLGIDPDATPTGCVFEPTRVVLTLPHREPGVATQAPEAQSTPETPSARTYLISAYGSTTAAVTTHGDVFVWGTCVPSGSESICGLSSRWEPQLVDIAEVDDASNDISAHTNSNRDGARLVWHSIAIADGLVVLGKHLNDPLT